MAVWGAVATAQLLRQPGGQASLNMDRAHEVAALALRPREAATALRPGVIATPLLPSVDNRDLVLIPLHRLDTAPAMAHSHLDTKGLDIEENPAI